MFTQILAPVDGSALAERALPFTARVAAPGGVLHLERVVDPLAHPAWAPAPDVVPADAYDEVAAAAYLDTLCARLAADGTRADAVTPTGSAPTEAADAECNRRRVLDAILMVPSRSAGFSKGLGRRFVPTVNRLVARAIHAGELRPDFTRQDVCLLGFMVGKVADITRSTDPGTWRRYAQLL